MKNYIQHIKLDKNIIIKKINSFLEEDLPHGDITTNLTIKDNPIIQGDIIAAENLIFSGREILPYCFNANIKIYFNDGENIKKDSI